MPRRAASLASEPHAVSGFMGLRGDLRIAAYTSASRPIARMTAIAMNGPAPAPGLVRPTTVAGLSLSCSPGNDGAMPVGCGVGGPTEPDGMACGWPTDPVGSNSTQPEFGK